MYGTVEDDGHTCGRGRDLGAETDLHLVDVGRVVAAPAVGGDGLAAAVWHQAVLGPQRLDVDAVEPVARVVAAAALELRGRGVRGWRGKSY